MLVLWRHLLLRHSLPLSFRLEEFYGNGRKKSIQKEKLWRKRTAIISFPDKRFAGEGKKSFLLVFVSQRWTHTKKVLAGSVEWDEKGKDTLTSNQIRNNKIYIRHAGELYLLDLFLLRLENKNLNGGWNWSVWSREWGWAGTCFVCLFQFPSEITFNGRSQRNQLK